MGKRAGGRILGSVYKKPGAEEDFFVFNDTIDGPEGLRQSAHTPTVANTAIEIATIRV